MESTSSPSQADDFTGTKDSEHDAFRALKEMLQDSARVHASILRGTIALTSEQAWHIAGGDERLRRERQSMLKDNYDLAADILAIIHANCEVDATDRDGKATRNCSACRSPISSGWHKTVCWLRQVTRQLEAQTEVPTN